MTSERIGGPAAVGSLRTSAARPSGLSVGDLRQILGVNVRDAEVSQYLQTFLVVAVATILITRLYLQLTGFPKIGGGSGLHVAHVLIGGALMTVSIVLLLGFLGKQVRGFASLLGGIGFGLFIDELGKFLTSDNNYFFHPTIALIYAVFVALFFWARSIERRKLSARAQVANAANVLACALVSGPSRRDLGRALYYLEKSGVQDPVVDALRTALIAVSREHPENSSPVAWSAAGAWRLYDRVTEWRLFSRVTRSVFVIRGVVGLAFVFFIAAAVLDGVAPAQSTPDVDRGVATLATLAALAVLALIMIGVVRFHGSRVAAYHWFEHGLLVSIFFAQFALFWLAELTAISLLIVDLVLLGAVRFLIRQAVGRAILRSLRDPRSQALQ
jgi:hypothetical protein